MWSKIINWANTVALINIVSPRRASTAYVKALYEADKDGNGELSIKELLKTTKDNFKYLMFMDGMTNDEIHKMIDEILEKKV